MGPAEAEALLGECGPDCPGCGRDLVGPINAALAKAREEGGDEVSTMIYVQGRSDAFAESASKLRKLAYAQPQDTTLNEGVASGYRMGSAEVIALAGQETPDTGWRKRPATPEEVEEHLDYWLRCWGDKHPSEQKIPNFAGHLHRNEALELAQILADDTPEEVEMRTTEWWRPVTRDIMPAPWPVLG